jgi:hypothetical protein
MKIDITLFAVKKELRREREYGEEGIIDVLEKRIEQAGFHAEYSNEHCAFFKDQGEHRINLFYDPLTFVDHGQNPIADGNLLPYFDIKIKDSDNKLQQDLGGFYHRFLHPRDTPNQVDYVIGLIKKHLK